MPSLRWKRSIREWAYPKMSKVIPLIISKIRLLSFKALPMHTPGVYMGVLDTITLNILLFKRVYIYKIFARDNLVKKQMSGLCELRSMLSFPTSIGNLSLLDPRLSEDDNGS